MRHVLVGGKIHSSGIDLLRAAPGISIEYIEEASTDSLIPMIHTADAVLLRTQPLSGHLIAECRNLKIVSRHGVGYDAVDMDALNERGIPLAIVGDVIARGVAEHAMMLILAASRRLLRYDAASRGGDWDYQTSCEARELYGKTLLIVGYGRIGRHLSRMAGVFGMSVAVHDPYLTKGDIDGDDILFATDLGSALRTADFVSLHVPRTEKPILAAREIAMLKPSAIIINTARGGVVDEKALAAALASGRLAAAGVDVYETEPPGPDHPLSKLDQAILTPHMASMTLEGAERMAIAAAQNIIDFFNGELDPDRVVNREAIGFSPGQ